MEPRRWYLKPGGVPLPESHRKAAEGARYVCVEGGGGWEEIKGWEPPEEPKKRPRATGRRYMDNEEGMLDG